MRHPRKHDTRICRFQFLPKHIYQLRDARQIYSSYSIFIGTHWDCFRKKNCTTRFFSSSVHFRQETGRMGPNISSEILALRDRQRLDFHRKSKYWEGSVLVFLCPPPLPREGPLPFGGMVWLAGSPRCFQKPEEEGSFSPTIKKKRIEPITLAYTRTYAQIEN